MKKLILIALSLLLVLGVTFVAYSLYNRPARESPQIQTSAATQPAATETNYPKAPDFTVYDADGKPVKRSDYLGKPVVLTFRASWCGPCKREMPEFEEAYLELKDEVVFLIINVTTSEKSQEDPVALMNELGYTSRWFMI